MKFFKRFTLIILILGTIGFMFREWFYNQTVNYKTTGVRPSYIASNPRLIEFIEDNATYTSSPDIYQIIGLSLSTTSKNLNFTADKNDNDPNKLISSQTAHCVGYATFFATTCNYLLKRYDLSDDWIAKPQIGQLYFLGNNVHKYLNSPFLKNHDFVTIENKTTGELLAVDPTVHDYLSIDFISFTD